MTPSRRHSGDRRREFPVAKGEVADLIRHRDWSATPLGPVESWPQTLRQSLENALSTTFPMSILWGEDYLQFYNDAYAVEMMGPKHPAALARPVAENWPEAKEEIFRMLEDVRQGGDARQRQLQMDVRFESGVRKIYFTFSYAPIFSAEGDVQGVLLSVRDETEAVKNRRRLTTFRDLGFELANATEPDEILVGATRVVGQNTGDIPFVVCYAQQREAPNRAEIVATSNIEPGTVWSPSWVELPTDGGLDEKTDELVTGPEGRRIDLEECFGPAPGEFADVVPTSAYVIPLTIGTDEDRLYLGCFLFGLHPKQPFDDNYRSFLMELVRKTGTAYENALKRREEIESERHRVQWLRKRIETEHLEERARLIDSIDQPFYALDRQWRIVYANSAARESETWNSRKVVGQCLWELFPSMHQTAAGESFRQVMAGGASEEFELELPEDDRIFDVRTFGWQDGIAVMFDDITDQRRIERALERTEARFRAVVEASLDVIAIVDFDGRFEFVSPAVETVFGQRPDELIGKSLSGLLTARGADATCQNLRRLVESREDAVKFQAPLAPPGTDGQRCWVSVRARDMRGNDGVDGILLNIRDITDIKRFESELVDAKERAETMSRLRTNILTNMSHEIRTPLTSMIGMASVLAEKVPKAQSRLADKIECSGMRLAQTLDSVLTLAKIESAALDIEVGDVKLSDEVDTAVQSLQKLATDERLEIEAVIDADPVVCADNSFLASILNNLIGNSIKFTDTGRVTVRVREDERWGIVEVEDTGIGIEADFLPHLFEQFRQASTGLSRSHEGTGLGLTIARRMTESMGGSITVLTTPGVGSTFTVTFPKRDREVGVDPSAQSGIYEEPVSSEKSGDSGERPSILVVEDDESIRLMLEHLFAEEFEVTFVADGHSALEKAADETFDLVLLDIGLPDMDGIEVLERLRANPEYEQRPIVALTGYVLPDDERRVADKEFTDYITKPFVPEELVDQLRRLV